ncbi:hypothetical protein DESUT3_09840 [Desulfuromonas versatilis]|uniref:DUF3024 domain-containing protein n=1 Tax=Desulfuromonas versatilis TaxID=2802975 RepID=A0ABN6DV15_9BACT|nr:DUF3024 domain-containing protein [Desulfuromonas versatilis]BCR03915.1 hypothetical protein DESUT3_09840 [Desulfuromonas versatilis]
MRKHPNEFTRRQILKYFEDRFLNVEVNAVENGYVIFFHRFSAIEACAVDDPAGRLLYDEEQDMWRLYWMSSRSQWHLYDRYDGLRDALDLMVSETAANLFHKVL